MADMPHPHDLVWKALADPTRRSILSILREAPRTTGGLAKRFPMSRFGIMKHLSVLEEAGLIRVERRGRERWNHLEPGPLEEVHRGWLRRFLAGVTEAAPTPSERLRSVSMRSAGTSPLVL